MERRRRWASSGWPCRPRSGLPGSPWQNKLFWGCWPAAEPQPGLCTLTIDHIAALAGVSGTTVRKAVREARLLGLLKVEERRLSAWRNLPNSGHHPVSRVAGLAQARPGGWVKFGSAHEYKRIKKAGQRSGTRLGLPKGRGPKGAATTNAGVRR